MQKNVVVVIGVGGMGLAIARRIGSGRSVLLADFNEATLEAAATVLRGEGHDVITRRVDVSDRTSVVELADAAAAAGAVTHVAHTAGLSPAQAPTAAILNVDLLGVAYVLDEFPRVIAPGGAGVVIASMAGHFAAPSLPAEMQGALAATPTDELLSLPFLAEGAVPDPGAAYSYAKRSNHLRVQRAAGAWGDAGARINSISPGVISTPMGQEELASESGERMRGMIAMSAAKRLGTPDDIAAAAAFLLDPQQSSFITGTDLLVDGGTVPAVFARGGLG
ncbi:SDR family oxidoreductase [Agromyces sp. NPDC058110]|uniref:SDR family oxidoreductase n=1 Tax=Agromyces sp. NPDC058110 TaxID=3346345 RepID=UPI0036DA1ED0